MTANAKASTTILWLKQLTTNTFSSINRRLEKIDFLSRNKKVLAVIAPCWCVVVITSIFLFNALAGQQREVLLAQYAGEAVALANFSAPLVLEDDLLRLNREVSEFARTRDLSFAAVVNHEAKIVAHTDAEKFNQPYEQPGNPESIATIGEVSVEAGQMTDGARVITFMKNITFSGVKIGSAVYAIPEESVGGIPRRFHWYSSLLILFFSIAAAAIVYNHDRRKRQLAANRMKVAADGTRIGPYRLKDKIAQGGMAELYIADYVREDGFKRQVAIKKVLPHLAENQDFIKMFIREARLAALLQHPNIVQIFDFGKIRDTYVIAMEYIQGMNLGQIMAHLKSPMPMDMAIFIIMKISLGLDYSHKRKDDESGQALGIVHRDVSPQNILISCQGEVKISDFGISKATTEPSFTQAGVIKGKLSYLAPEQALGQPVDHRIDIYSLGLVFYEVLSGRRLYQFDTDIEAIRKIPEMVIPQLSLERPGLPEGLERVVMKCLEKDKNQRYDDAMALHDDLLKLKIKLQMAYDASDLSNFMRTILNHA
ncbi:MAG: serine/threonine protein kinase [Desulfobacteraceae bacterium]|nr:MAG: serine/threonine protein kinase [Desulfobacteraceae bacterium]